MAAHRTGPSSWGLIKQTAHAIDPAASLDRAWERCHERLFSTVELVAADDMHKVQGFIEAHAKALDGFLKHPIAAAK